MASKKMSDLKLRACYLFIDIAVVCALVLIVVLIYEFWPSL